MRNRFTCSLWIFLLLLLAFKPRVGSAQSLEKAYSLMLLNFAKGINWPASGHHEFVIGVVEYQPLLPDLISTTSNSKIYGKKIRVVEIRDPADARSCQMVFVPAYKAGLLQGLLENVSDLPILIVTNKTGIVQKGGGIDLVLREGKLTFDINCASIERRGLKVGSAIRSSGTVVN